MKSIMITFDQAHYDGIIRILDHLNCRGFTSFGTVQGRGSDKGEPHYGSHAWPSLGGAIITIVDDAVASSLLSALQELDNERPKLGLRAFQWNVEKTI